MTERRVSSAMWYQTARHADKLADDYRAKAMELERHEVDHECGHQWTIAVSSVEHYGITGDPQHYDGQRDPEPLPTTVTVRAHNLSDALRKAAAMPLDAWFPEENEPENEETSTGTSQK